MYYNVLELFTGDEVKYYKNTELARIHGVSEKSVRNWVHAAGEGRLDMQTYDHNGKSYIANTSKNNFLIEQLVEKGKKYKNSRGLKTLVPTEKFFETYSAPQILDIISHLQVRHEIPLQYSYADGGANYWDQFANRLLAEENPNILKKTIKLIDSSTANIDGLIAGHSRVNVIDLGPGNGLPIRPTLERLHKKGILGKYIAIDISKEMLAILERNINKWFGGAIKFEGYVRDIRYERFDDIVASDYSDDGNVPVNLVFLLGGTLSNLRNPNAALQTINNSFGLQDLLVYIEKIDSPNTRRYFDFNISNQAQKLTPRHKLILDMLNIDEAYYDVEQLFDVNKRARTISIKPKLDLEIEFQIHNGVRRVELRKNEPITLWRAWVWTHLDVIQQFEQGGFELMCFARDVEPEYMLAVTKLKVEE
jgi:hypothetical protein